MYQYGGMPHASVASTEPAVPEQPAKSTEAAITLLLPTPFSGTSVTTNLLARYHLRVTLMTTTSTWGSVSPFPYAIIPKPCPGLFKRTILVPVLPHHSSSSSNFT